MQLSDGHYDVVTIDKSAKLVYWSHYDGSLTTVQSVPLTHTPNGWYTFSRYDKYLSVWVNDYLVAVFTDCGSSNVGLCSNGYAFGMKVDWPALDQRVDNFIMEMGQTGGAFLMRLLGQKRVFVKDDQNGGLYAFRTRPNVNFGNPIDLIYTAGDTLSDTALKTRVRLEGLETAEEVDYDALRLYGNLFARANAEELELQDEFVKEALAILSDAVSVYRVTTLYGAADPRVEPNDVLSVSLPDGDREVIVTGINYRLAQSEDSAMFDMEVGARNA